MTAGEELSDLTASRDLRAMVDSGFLAAVGEKRGRYYVASPDLTRLREDVRAERPPREDYDPFALAAKDLQLTFDT